MNNPSPFSPQRPILEQKNKSRQRVFMIASVVVAANVVLLMTLLMIGCRKPTEPEAMPAAEPSTAVAPFEPDTNLAPAIAVVTNPPDSNTTAYIPPPADTNVYVPPVAPSAPAGAGQDYKIEKGDMLVTLATKFGVSVKAIQDANPGLDPRRLKIGQVVHIPAPATTESAASPGATVAAPAATASDNQIYKVKSGDTLTSIARHHGVTVKALRSANNLTSDRIVVGQKLKIPSKPSTAAPMAVPAAGA